MNLKRYLRPSLLLLAVVGLAACNNSYGVFSSIQEENKNTTTSTFFQAAVPELTVFGGSYYVRLVGIYSRPASSAAASGWSYLDESSFGSDYVCRGMAATGAGLYVAIRNGRGSTSTPNGIFMYDGSSWSHVYAGTENIQALHAVNGNLFAVTREGTSDSGYTYSLRHWNGSNLEATGINAVSSMPTNGAYLGSAYWFAAGSNLYSNASATALAQVTDPTTATITALATDGIGGAAASALFLGDSSGSVYRYDGSWSTGKLATYSTSYGVVSMTAVPTGTAGSGRALLVGSSYVGYYEADVTSGLGDFATGDKTQIVAAESNYDSSLGNMPVMSFVYSGTAAEGTLFACATAMAVDYTGLWSNKRSANAWSAGWASE